MHIQVRYQTNPETLAKASLIYLEQKWSMKLSLVLFNIVGLLFIFLILIKISMTRQMSPVEAGIGGFCLAWICGRRWLTESILRKRMQKQGTYKKEVTVDISKNGVMWSGQGLKQGHMAWKDIPLCIRTENGYIVSASMAKFLWLPFSGFDNPSSVDNLKSLCDEFKVPIKNVKRSC